MTSLSADNVITAPASALSRAVDPASLPSSDLDCSAFTFGAYVVVFGAMFVFGTVGNCLSWAVLRWDRRSSGRVATFLLQTMAVVDNLFLLTAFISHFTSALAVYVESSSLASSLSSAAEDVPQHENGGFNNLSALAANGSSYIVGSCCTTLAQDNFSADPSATSDELHLLASYNRTGLSTTMTLSTPLGDALRD